MQQGQEQPYDLRSLFKAVGRVGGRGGENAAVERVDSAEEIAVIDEHPLEVTCEPLAVSGFVDGIQASMHLTHIDRRPVCLYYVAAGALGDGAKPLMLVEKLRIQCAEQDTEWVEGLGSNIPLEIIPAMAPPEMENLAQQNIGRSRDAAERLVVENMVAADLEGVVVVDGSLLTRPRSNKLVGVVKTTRSRYLGDETVVFDLRKGWRSPRFSIGTGNSTRYSCYVQLIEKSDGAWNLGLIRLESFDIDLLEPMAARCLRETQTASSGDPRWDRHLGSVAAVEHFLKARKPAPFSM
jgi:hypothetical protein